MEDKRDKSCSYPCALLSLLLVVSLLIIRWRSLWTFLAGVVVSLAAGGYLCYYLIGNRRLKSTASDEPPAPVASGRPGVPPLESKDYRPREIEAVRAAAGASMHGKEEESDGYGSEETEAVRIAGGASTPTFWYPELIDSREFFRRTAHLEMKATVFRVDGTGPEQMRTRAAFALQRLNLHLVTNDIHAGEGQTWVKLAGWARSRSAKPRLGVEVNISGIAGAKKCLCRVLAYSDAPSELQPALDSIRTMLTFVSPIEPVDSRSMTRQARPVPVQSIQIAPPDVLVGKQVQLSDDMLVFTVTVTNRSSYPLQDVDAFLISYPSTLLTLITDDSNGIPVLEPGLSQLSQFTLRLSSDSCRGELIAAVSFFTPDGRSYTVAAEPFSLVPVRGMLEPDPIEKNEFDLRATRFQTGETTFKTEDWTPEEMYEKAMRALSQLGFHLVEYHADTSDELLMAEVDGAARGKAMHKSLVVTLVVYGTSHAPQTSCRIIAAGEQESMVFPSIEEIKSRLEAWPCPSCKSDLTAADVHRLKSGGIIKCSACGKTMDLGRYRSWIH